MFKYVIVKIDDNYYLMNITNGFPIITAVGTFQHCFHEYISIVEFEAEMFEECRAYYRLHIRKF